MAETPDRPVGKQQRPDTPSPTTTEMRAAICETRVRLATRLTRTADHVHVLFSAPSSAQVGSRDRGVIGGAVKAIAVAGRTRRAWSHAKRTGVLRRAAIGAATVVMVAGFAAYRRRR